MKRHLSRIVASVTPPVFRGGVRVLLYHAIDDPDPSDRMALRVSRQRFVEQMRLLRDGGYRVVPLAAVCATHTEHDRVGVAITFDDGYRSQAWAAATLKEFGFPATFFMVPRFLDGVRVPQAYWESWGHLRWDEATALIDDGFEIGAHSATHPDLRTCTDSQLDHEVAGSKTLLEERLGRGIVSFSYPYGRHDARVRRAVERSGYQIGCTSRYGLNRRPGPSNAVLRTEVSGADDMRDFEMKLHGRYDWLGYWQDVRPA